MPAAEVAITSFGFLHGPPPAGQHLVVDVRGHFRDPHFSEALRDLDATDPRVYQAVTTTRGVTDLTMAAALAIAAFRSGPVPGPVAIAIGCAGGRHRAAGIAIALSRLLDDWGIPASVAHRDIARPVVERAAADARGASWAG
jgi:RNase adaptor protein for sRNA GlmZ degradation